MRLQEHVRQSQQASNAFQRVCLCMPPAGEDQYGVLAQYYSIPWLSYRDAVWHDYFADSAGFKRYEIFPTDEERHPTPLGHRCGMVTVPC